jgi:hypothetical protein
MGAPSCCSGTLVDERRIVKDLEAIARGLNEVLERGQLSGGTDENHGKRQSKKAISMQYSMTWYSEILASSRPHIPVSSLKGYKKCYRDELSENYLQHSVYRCP